jgi:hypothetical protein
MAGLFYLSTQLNTTNGCLWHAREAHFLSIIEDKCKKHMNSEPDNWYYLLISKGRFEKRVS